MVVGACLFAVKILLMLEPTEAVACAKRGIVRLRVVAVTMVKVWVRRRVETVCLETII
jgi:uncharacterized protein YqkB